MGATTWFGWSLFGLGIVSAYWLHLACQASNQLPEKWMQGCFYLCVWKIVGAIVIKLLECCVNNECPDEEDCSPMSNCYASIITELPLLAFSILIYMQMSPCKSPVVYRNFSDILKAGKINGFVSLLLSLYYLVISCGNCENGVWYCHAIHTIAAVVVIFYQCSYV